MNDILKNARAARKEHSEYLARAIELMAGEGSLLAKQVRLSELSKAAPASEAEEFAELYEKLAREHLDGR